METLGAGGEGRLSSKRSTSQHDRLVALKIRAGPVWRCSRGSPRRGPDPAWGAATRAPPARAREDFFDGDRYVVAMDWVEGTDLARLLRKEGRPGLSPSSVMRWLSDAASALTHLHTLERPVMHGDVKPANLILTRGGRVVLVDFGLSSTPGSLRRRGGARPVTPRPSSWRVQGQTVPVTSIRSPPPASPCSRVRRRPGFGPSWDGLDPAAAEQLEEALRLGLATDPVRRPQTPTTNRAASRGVGARPFRPASSRSRDGHRGIDTDVGCAACGDGPSAGSGTTS